MKEISNSGSVFFNLFIGFQITLIWNQFLKSFIQFNQFQIQTALEAYSISVSDYPLEPRLLIIRSPL